MVRKKQTTVPEVIPQGNNTGLRDAVGCLEEARRPTSAIFPWKA